MSKAADHASVERWGVYEVQLSGPADGNPYVGVALTARFQHRHRAVEIAGFYDGNGTYIVRFSPDTLGSWCYETLSDRPVLAGHSGSFECVAPAAGNHGPVQVANRHHFRYADGTPYRQIGTTCYAWIHQPDALQRQTLETLAAAPFNKMRMCVFPKHYAYNTNEPALYPYERDAGGAFDWFRFASPFWRHLEGRILDLQRLGIEADLILFHPYDRWGFSDMGAEANACYLRYATARLAAFRNVWWSMANEYDLMTNLSIADWDRLFLTVQESDPYGRLRSIHNCRGFYDHSRPWVTHASVQHWDLYRAHEWRQAYGKPIIDDECQYEGNIPRNWGNISAEELVHRFWLGTVAGIYMGHGETYIEEDDILWWSKGGILRGESPARLAFLRKALEEAPAQGLEPLDARQPGQLAGVEGEYYLWYSGVHQPAEWVFRLPEDRAYRIEVLDTWNMTVTPLDGTWSGEAKVRLPGRPYTAVRIRRA